MKAVVVQRAGAALSALQMVNGWFGAESKIEWEDGTRLVSFIARNRPVPANCFCQGVSHTPFGNTDL